MSTPADPAPPGQSASAAPEPALREAVLQAARRIAGDVRRTPLWRLPGSALGLPVAEVWLKLEHLQVGGSFKARGMFNHLRQARLPPSGVVIASGGNAGIAAATAARALGVRCEVFVPAASSPAKRAALQALGAVVQVQGQVYAEALLAARARQQETGALWMHAYNLPEVWLGAGTLAAEIEVETGEPPDRVLVSVGGGGLIAGILAWWAGRSQVIALEPERAPTLYAALQAGHPVEVEVSGLAADALGARQIGDGPWPLLKTGLSGAHLLPDAAIAAAQRQLWSSFRLAVEPAAALGLAALTCGRVSPAPHERIALILCGANLDPATL